MARELKWAPFSARSRSAWAPPGLKSETPFPAWPDSTDLVISRVAAQALREVAILLPGETESSLSFDSSWASGDLSRIEATWRSVCANFSSSRAASRDGNVSNFIVDSFPEMLSQSSRISLVRLVSSYTRIVLLHIGTSKLLDISFCWWCFSIMSNEERPKVGGGWFKWSECCLSFVISLISARLLNWLTESIDWARFNDWLWMRPSWLAIRACTSNGLCDDWLVKGLWSSEDDFRFTFSLLRTAWAMFGKEGEENIEFWCSSGFKASTVLGR